MSMSNGPRFRFAPSPTGFFHVGGARTALFNWALAKQLGGTFVLRVEDTDEARNQPEWTQGIIDALAWLGINADDSAFEGPYFQSHYAALHVAAAHRLFQSGHAYYCDLPPGAAGDAAGTRANRDRGLGPGDGRVLRFRVPDGRTTVSDQVRGDVDFDNDVIEDFVLLRGNGTPMFLLANVVDDVEMAITHVVRAEEHLPNTPKQQMIWQALGHQPPVWAHVPVLVNEQRKKLSKRRDKVALEMYRDEGYLAPAMINYLMTLGWSPGDHEIVDWPTMQAAFRLEDVNLSPAFFDIKKLGAFNGEYIRAMPVDRFSAACLPYLLAADAPWPTGRFDRFRWDVLAPHVQLRCTRLSDVPATVDFLFLADPVWEQDAWSKAIGVDGAALVFDECRAGYATVPAGDWSADRLKAIMDVAAERQGLKLGKAQAPVRAAITGRLVGPPLFEALEALGQSETVRRLDVAAEQNG
jgi:glutamyl-tRNA synthetase